MPTSVLLAILAGAVLLALAPALVRRYDADERAAAEREESRARVVKRGSQAEADSTSEGESDSDSDSETLLAMECPPEEEGLEDELESESDSEAVSERGSRTWERKGTRRGESVRWNASRSKLREQEVSVASARLRAWRRQRYRRVLYVLLALNLVEILGVIVIGPGFWLGLGISLGVLVAYLWFLRTTARREPPRTRSTTATTGRRVYVPSQSEGDKGERSAAGIVPGFDDDDDDDDESEAEAQDDQPAPSPPPRRSGHVRGRSYESPASL